MCICVTVRAYVVCVSVYVRKRVCLCARLRVSVSELCVNICTPALLIICDSHDLPSGIFLSFVRCVHFRDN